jgi:hypothetical protein
LELIKWSASKLELQARRSKSHRNYSATTKEGQIARIDAYWGIVAICSASQQKHTYDGEMVHPNTGLYNEKIAETPWVDAGQARPRLSDDMITLYKVWTRCMRAASALPASNTIEPMCELCGETNGNVMTCALCGERTIHRECDVAFRCSGTRAWTDAIDGLDKYDRKILPDCISGGSAAQCGCQPVWSLIIYRESC